MNPSSLLLARTPPVASTSTYSTHIPSARPNDHIFQQQDSSSSTTPLHSPTTINPPNRTLKLSSKLQTSNPDGSLPNLHPTFRSDTSSPCQGTVQIIVESTTFLVHKEIIVFASPFFETIIGGEWAETCDLTSSQDHSQDHPHESDLTIQNSSIDPYSRTGPIETGQSDDEPSNSQTTNILPTPSTVPGSTGSLLPDQSTSQDFNPLSDNIDGSSSNGDPTGDQLNRSPSSLPSSLAEAFHTTEKPSTPKTNRLNGPSPALKHMISKSNLIKPVNSTPQISKTSKSNQIEARIFLQEEKAAPFQDLLMFVYPHLECVCTWNNAPELMTMSRKFDMPYLQRHVLNFLLSSAAGKPIQAMKIAEDHQLPDLYRESSRFLLDNWQGWDPKELDILSSETLLKLEKRRTWFLERLLKLGLVNSSRDYVCPPTCSDPQHCAKLVDDKWRSAWASSFKFGPPQPSSVYRALRCLEPSLHSPSLLLPHTSCQQHAIRFFADLFDRMFSQFPARVGINNNVTGTGTATGTGTGTGGAAHSHSNSSHFSSLDPIPVPITLNGTSVSKASRHAKYFLHVELFEAGGFGKDRERRIF
ncbi:uncharacterized protein MELLADRAFT_87038 [Melampsora larici-populina 98AG31]|uniref:BTB domain-containing protein n=1 Tax=Melampsora larici-populina (strain 98AG31 / pathotype 3-4-7) TaxID=747676 RepID=F4R4A7_MELLP|nr:uncharacterized protein MELLADRAFT_87038 [Melampsora larici-populina 98AG31]EGG12776.1 hypothetical protein MELLADRAFT_87038 [Melampsora larici-populina 98AG31]